jgi:hypothetical protein
MHRVIPIAALLVVVGTTAFVRPAASEPAAALPPGVLAQVRYEGGLCVNGGVCMTQVVVFQDGRVRWPERKGTRLSPAQVRALRRAIAAIDMREVRAHPFTGTCPPAYDGQEAVYRFRGPTPVLRGCRYDLTRVAAVQLLERLLAR